MSVFNRYLEFYKSPRGAVRKNQVVTFRIMLPLKYDVYPVAMITLNNISRKHRIVMLDKDEIIDNNRVWKCEFIPKEIGVYWYNFKINILADSKEYIIPGKDDTVIITSFLDQMLPMEKKYWRMTVYENDFETPQWLLGGVVYQIFPDRFNKILCKDKFYSGRRIHNNWIDFPCWKSIEEFMGSTMDFYEGNIAGIINKVDYLKELGVTCVYLNPIFESTSSHRYNTGNYEKVDDMLGENEDFVRLCVESKKNGIKIINDGVFSHTGSDSKYFNIHSSYNTIGAYNSKDKSDYKEWYSFYKWPNYYNSWWNFDTLPKLNLNNEQCCEYFLGENGIIEQWFKYGNSGWRLDAVDDLPDEFLEKLRYKVKQLSQDNLIVGEVWHDASLEKYVGHDTYPAQLLLGKQLDTVTNYQFRDIIIEYVKGKDAKVIMKKIYNILDNYPKPVVDIMFNLLGSHDTARILTVLGKTENVEDVRGYIEDNQGLSDEEYQQGIRLLKIAVAIQFTLPGVPCIYYGDEIGMEGYNDPYNRAPFTWNRINEELLEWYKKLSEIRKTCEILKKGILVDLMSQNRVLAYRRESKKECLECFFNASNKCEKINFNKETQCKYYIGSYNNGIIPKYGVVIYSYEK